MSGEVRYHKLSPAIGEMVVAQPERRNALNAKMWAQVPALLETALTDSALRVLIVRGEGDHFAAGADISEFETLYATPKSAAKISETINSAFAALAEFPLPTIAKIRGACVGGGAGLALCCDLRFAEKKARFAITPAKLGLLYPFADVRRLIEAVGLANAKDMLFSARALNAKQAAKIGLIHKKIAAKRLDEFTLAYAQDLAKKSGYTQRGTKKMFAAYQAGLRLETSESQQWLLDGFSSEDFNEGYRAFLAKRAADFSS